MAKDQPSIPEEKPAPVVPPLLPKGGDTFRQWLIFLVLILVLAGIIGAAYYVFFTGDAKVTITQEDGSDITLSAATPVFVPPLSYQVNLADGRRFLAVDVRLEVLDVQTSSFINGRLPIVNDIILSTLQRRSANDLRSAAGVDRLKRDLKRRLNTGKLFTDNFIAFKNNTSPVVGVYFDKFILQ